MYMLCSLCVHYTTSIYLTRTLSNDTVEVFIISTLMHSHILNTGPVMYMLCTLCVHYTTSIYLTRTLYCMLPVLSGHTAEFI